LLANPTPHNVNQDNDRFSMFNKAPYQSAEWVTELAAYHSSSDGGAAI
jgi:hypothetical protein